MTHQVDVVAGRDCRGCTMCCKLLSVEEIANPPMSWCPSCDPKAGCGIYRQRPLECRQFYCEYLLDPALSEEWKPSKCKIVVVREDHTNALGIHVDADRPNAWREAPFHSVIGAWAHAADRRQERVIVWQGNTKVVLSQGNRASPRADAHPPAR